MRKLQLIQLFQLKSNPQLQETIKNLQTKIDEATANLKKDNPEVAANAQKVIDQVKGAYDSVTKELERVNSEVNKKGGLKDDLETLLKGLIDRGSAAAKELQVMSYNLHAHSLFDRFL